MRSLGLYLHIPFCRSKCLYCDFCSFPRPDGETVDAYVKALCRDLVRRAEDCRAYTVDTVYLGGGTPTLLGADPLCRIMETVFSSYRLSETAEITAECNPKTGGREQFSAMRRAGFNRLSIGLQSAHATELRALGRIHSFDDFKETFLAAREAGFSNISADVMMGIPHQSLSSYFETLDLLMALSPEHISAYGLTVEEGTPFGRMGDRLILPDEETEAAQYFGGIERLAASGYRQYEISNFARSGYESRHNLKYWNCEEYLGFGPAAHSDFSGVRFGNSRDMNAYLAGKDITEISQAPNRDERIAEYVMLRMRLAQGVRFADFESRFGVTFDESFGTSLRYANDPRLVCRDGERIAFTPTGMRVSNAILSEWLDFGK